MKCDSLINIITRIKRKLHLNDIHIERGVVVIEIYIKIHTARYNRMIILMASLSSSFFVKLVQELDRSESESTLMEQLFGDGMGLETELDDL